ncbi:acyl-CoA acyltransferase [Afipia sp. Root123D2]|nr:acyl-CoA acyltransferase [Afipia sp. Root123D2]
MIEVMKAAEAAVSNSATYDEATLAPSANAALPAAAPAGAPLVKLSEIPVAPWRQLADRAAEANGYYLPEWELAVNAFSRGRTGVSALAAWNDRTTGDSTFDAVAAANDNDGRLIGLMPAISAWRAYRIPLPALVTADAFPPLGTLLLDRDHADAAAGQLMQQARNAGAHALILRDLPLDGAVMKAFTKALAWTGLRPHVLHSHQRAMLDATRDAEELLRDALGPKKMKELRRQRNRLADIGDVVFSIAGTTGDAAPALETFLKLEASGWKARRGTALIQDEGHLAFIRRAVCDMAARGNCEVISLYAGDTPLASAIVLRHLDRAFYFKLGVDERFAKYSPGVQLTLELTRHMCADDTIATVDSTAIPNHPMIDPIWRDRLAIGDVLIPLRRNDPLVPAIRAALALRQAIREPARRAVHTLRKLKEKRS